MMSTQQPCTLSAWPRSTKGYACRSKRVGKKVTKVYAHRQAWEAEHGPIPEGMTVHHRCGVKPCIEVSHLELMTVSQNAAIGRPCSTGGCLCACHAA